jgi:hypothetical protein
VCLLVAGACNAFGSDPSADGKSMPDATDGGGGGGDSGASGDAGDAGDAGLATTATIRCGTIACPASTKCCLPLEQGDAGCVDRNAVCGNGFAELLCSSPSACQPNEACCVASQRNSGQTAFDIARSFCVTESACPDQNLQRSLCDLGASSQCPNRACKPYVHDIDDTMQDLPLNPTGYATCQ